MATIYTINYSDVSSDSANKQPFSISPGEINSRTSLKLPGQGAALYGEHVAESFLHALENFCSGTPPTNATKGQLWYDSTAKLMKVLESITTVSGVKTYKWVPVGRILVSTTQPTETGSLWYDTSNADPMQHQLKIYSAVRSTWVSVADRYLLKTGDSITGDIKAVGAAVGLIGYTGVESNGVVNRFQPSTARGPVMSGTQHATVMISTTGTTGNSFVVSGGQSNVANADLATAALLRVKDTGEVQVVRGNLNVTSNKIVNLAAGSASADAVNFSQLSALQTQVTANSSNKVNRVGDTMTGVLTIQTAGVGNGNGSAAGEGTFALIVKGTGTDSGGILIHAQDDNNDENGIEIINTYGPGGATQRVFSIKSFTGDTSIAGNVTMSKALTVAGALNVTGAATIQAVSTMNVAVSAIVNARHLTTKEYVDAKVAGVASTADYAEINPASPTTGHIRVTGTGASLRIDIFGDGAWRQVFPAQWAA